MIPQNALMAGQPMPAGPDAMAANDDAAYESKTPLETLIAWFEDAEEATETARKLSERDRDYKDGNQLTAAELKALAERGQPDVIVNRIQSKVNYLIGFEANNRTDPKGFPRTPQDEGASEACTDALRYVEDAAEMKPKFSNVWENMLVEGYGGIELLVEERTDQATGQPKRDIAAVEWDWDRLFYDPHSRKPDFSDARYLGGVVWMDAEDAREMWPGEEQAEAIEKTVLDGHIGTTYDDRPEWKKWTAGKGRKRVRIVQMYHREGRAWWLCKFTKGGKLESMPVPFKDQNGDSWCPLLLQSAFVNRKNERYGIVRSMISVQDEINKRRSKALHRLSMRQVRAERGAVDDVDAAKKELGKPDGWVETNPGFEFELLSQGDQLAAELTMLQEAKNEIELMGPNASMQGKGEDAASGRAILANQSGGQTEISVLVDRHRQLKKRCYQRMWDLIRQFKDEQWWIRVTDNEENVKFVGFNRPVTVRDELMKRAEAAGVPPEKFAQRIMELEADPNAAQQLEQVVRTENNPAQMYMDITVEEVPDTANIQMEQFDALVKLAPAVVFPPSVYIKASGLRNKRELLDELQTGGQKEDPAATELKMRGAVAEVAKLEAEVEKIKSEAVKIRVEANMALQPDPVVTDPAVEQGQAAQSVPASVQASPPPGAMGDPAQPPPGLTGVDGMAAQ
jgi:hypothetical protein